MHEAKLYDRNCVVTLTYNDANLPDDRGLVKRDLQLFMKRLRKEFVTQPDPEKDKYDGIRFYACGEYGENTRRPHYHCILFNFAFRDLRQYKKSKTGDNLYTSETAERLWGKGFCVVGEVTFESCAYVARYIVDKMTGEKADQWYTTDDGVIVQSEFTNMSRRPGIGRGYYEKYGAEVMRHDSVIMNAMPVRPPRYYDLLSDAVDSKRMAVLKKKRRREALKHQDDNTPERRRVKETVAVLNLNMWKRNVT